jgi:hypothetical protein
MEFVSFLLGGHGARHIPRGRQGEDRGSGAERRSRRIAALHGKQRFPRDTAQAVSHQNVEYQRDPRVDEYIDRLPEWQQQICRELRDLIHATDPEVVETIKRRVQPYFVLDGNVCALLAAKDHVNLFLYDGAIVPDPEGIITGGHANKAARTVAFWQGDAIKRRALTAMLKQIIANNRAAAGAN